MVNCSFCGYPVSKGTGKMYVKKDGTTFNYCSSKCEKQHLKLGRSNRVTPWTKQFRKEKTAQKK
jgi:large subunit ribosomal protein L24e